MKGKKGNDFAAHQKRSFARLAAGAGAGGWRMGRSKFRREKLDTRRVSPIPVYKLLYELLLRRPRFLCAGDKEKKKKTTGLQTVLLSVPFFPSFSPVRTERGETEKIIITHGATIFIVNEPPPHGV